MVGRAHCKANGAALGLQEVELKNEAAKPKDAERFAVFESGGKQHRVARDETVRLERLPGQPGDTVLFQRVLLVSTGDEVLIGTPYVKGGLVTGELVAQGRHPKIRVIKFKRRKNYLRRKGHRQEFSDVRITGISHASEIAQAAAKSGDAQTPAVAADDSPAAEPQAEAA